MTPQETRRWRAPAGDGEALIAPDTEVGPLIAANRQHFSADLPELRGRALGDVRAAAQVSFRAAAHRYTSTYSESSLPDGSGPLILAGHQPQLFHPGVWFKNFAIGQLANTHGGAAVNLIIDSDLCRNPAIQVPVGGSESPRTESVAYDTSARAIPHEERTIEDAPTFDRFSNEVSTRISPLVEDPIVRPLWREAVERRRQLASLGLCIAQARHLVEKSWGNQTLELPVSHVCELPEVRWLVAVLLADLPQFRRIYNGVLTNYRRRNRVRNSAQPVPDLTEQDDWLETPFWFWTAKDPERRPLFARREKDQVALANSEGLLARLTLPTCGKVDEAVRQLAHFSAQRHWKLRTRALSTTLVTRLLLADLFVHGIGGANYDVVTDRILAEYFRIRPPAFMTLSATFRLPSSHERVTLDDRRRLTTALRNLTYHPEKFLPPLGAASHTDPAEREHWLSLKNRWVKTPKTHANAKQRHDAIAAANAGLQPLVRSQREAIESERAALDEMLRAASVLDSREYSFCLFSAQFLPNNLLDQSARMR